MSYNCQRMALIKLLFLLLTLAKVSTDKVQVLRVPNKATWNWSVDGPEGSSLPKWYDQTIPDPNQQVAYYAACSSLPDYPPNSWLRSDPISVNNTRRIDVTVEYSVVNCSAPNQSPNYCKTTFSIYAHLAKEKYRPDKIPNPYMNTKMFEKISAVDPKVLAYPKIKKMQNVETHPIEVKPGYPYVYIALHYTGGCFVLYGVSAHYYQCPSKALSKSLIQLPRTIAPPKGWKQVKGLCAANAQPKTNADDLFGYCDDQGNWREHKYNAVCQCEAGYHEVATRTGTECSACPVDTFKNIAGNSTCKACPKHSQQEIDRTSCACEPGYYRADTETIFDPCTAPPSAPESLRSISHNATSIRLEWSPPNYSGGRSHINYEIDCKLCDSNGEHCDNDCDDVQKYLQYLSNTSTLATINNLSPYTYYEFKVFAKNGVSQVAEKDKNEAKFAKLVIRTAEGVPDMPDIIAAKSATPTSVFLRWKIDRPNGVIKYYQVSYYPVGHQARKKVFNTTHTNVTINGLKGGQEYVFQVQAGTRLGLGKPRGTSQILPPENDENIPFSWEILAGIVGAAGVFLILVLIIVIICLHRKRRRYIQARSSSMEKLDGIIPVDGHKLYIDPSNYGNPMEALMSVTEEIDRRRIKLEKLIGGGEFAEVYKGTLISYDNKPETVAVKILKPKSTPKNREDFILEASIMGQFEHANVLGLKGVVTRSPETPMMIVTEFMENGSLDHYLKNHDSQLTILQLLGMARGVAAGMDYLSAMNFIHRDLAARNILVAENMATKVADFGLSRELDDSEDNPHSEYQTQGGKIPVRWTAPEAIRYRKFSSASDVWSFGILLWEIMAFAERPYWDWDNFQVMDRVESGYRLPAPMSCPKSIHNLMLDCWDAEKNNRPKFPCIVTQLDEMIRSPEKLKSDQNHFHTLNNSNHTNFHDVHTIEEWLGSINMGRYATHFANAGYMDLGHVKSLEEQDLSRIGVRLIGHRNKINKSIKAMNKHFESMESNDSENQSFV